jgi:hypothetical protein
MTRRLGVVVRWGAAASFLGALGVAGAGCSREAADGGGFTAQMPDASLPSTSNEGGIGGGADTAFIPLPSGNGDSGGFVISTGDEGGTVGPAPDAGAPNSLKLLCTPANMPPCSTTDPSAATVVVGGGTPMSATFTLVADYGNGPINVTAEAVEFDRPDLANSPQATEPLVVTAPPTGATTFYAGTGTLHAIFAGVEAKATLTVQVQLTAYGTGLTATTPSVMALAGANLPMDPATGGKILYPYDGTIWPLGLQSPLTMWNGPSANDVVRMHYAEANYTIDYYATGAPNPASPGQAPGQARLDQLLWDRLTNSNAMLHGTKDPITFTLSRWDSATMMAYTSGTETWNLAPESLRGTIYYWSASRGATGGRIVKFNPGPGATPTTLTTTGACAGCHAVNSNGTVLVADTEDKPLVPSVAPFIDPFTGSRAWISYDLTQATGTPVLFQSNEFGADPALTPDGKYLVFGGPRGVPGAKYLSLTDPKTGTVITTSGLDSVVLDTGETNLEMPAFSPDGSMLALVEAAYPGTYPKDRGASDNVLSSAVIPPVTTPPKLLPDAIAYLTFNEAGPSFNPTLHKVTSSADPTLAAAPGLAYPSFTPDSKAIAFHAGTEATGCNSTGCNDDALDNGDLYVSLLASGGPVRMAKADDPPDTNDLHSSIEPTFNPVVRGGYSWAVFTSMRKFGNVPWGANVTALTKCAGTALCNGKRQLWLAPVDTTIGTTDPSHPAIYLEGQDFTTPNMRGFYTLASCIPSPGAMPPPGAPQVGTKCTTGFECCSGFCSQNAQCIEPSQATCVGFGGACTVSGDCCNSQIVQCIGGMCKVPITR